MSDQTSTFVTILSTLLVVIIVYMVYIDICEDKKTEKFGALQSLYSNDGIQDAYLTLENDPDNPYYQDPYAYWRDVTWDLPTRNLHRVAFYPYLYEYQVDRYGVVWPYWSP
jgi:hypothetical protein